MRNKIFNLLLVIFLLKGTLLFSKEKIYRPVDSKIMFKDYKNFVFYTRDSVMIWLMAFQIEDYGIHDKDGKFIGINWNIDVDLKDEETFDILTSSCDFEEIGHLYYVENNKLFVNTNKLLYNSVNIFPDIEFIDFSKFDNKLSPFNQWLENYDTLDVAPYLSERQIEVYKDWFSKTDEQSLEKILRIRVNLDYSMFPCDSTFDYRYDHTRIISKQNDGTYRINAYNYRKKLVYIGNFSSVYPENKNGEFFFYDKSGSLYAEGYYINNYIYGNWKYIDKQKDTVFTINYSLLYKKIQQDKEVFKLLIDKHNLIIHDLDEVDKEPEFQNKIYQNFDEYLIGNFQLPPFSEIDRFRKSLIATVEFVIDKNGKLRFPNILEGKSEEFNIELYRLLLNSPQWMPAIKYNEKVNVLYKLEISY